MMSLMPELRRSIGAAFRKTKPAWCHGSYIGALVLTLVLEAALATDPQIEFIERYGTNQVTIHFNTDAMPIITPRQTWRSPANAVGNAIGHSQ